MMAMLQCCLLVFLLVGCQIHTAESAVAFLTNPVSASVSEDEAVDTIVVTVTATDDDSKTLAYTLESQDPDTTPKVFSIDGSSGAIKVSDATKLDYETTKGYKLLIKAKQSGETTPASATTTVSVTVTDLNEAPPTFSKALYTACVNKGSAGGTNVSQVTATDADTANTLSYTISGGNAVFDVETGTGTIKVATTQTIGETPASYNLTLIATDNGSPSKSGTTTVSIDVADPCKVVAPAPGVTPAHSFATTTKASFCLFVVSGTVHLLHIW